MATKYSTVYKSAQLSWHKKLKIRLEAKPFVKKMKAAWAQYQYDKKKRPPPGILAAMSKKIAVVVMGVSAALLGASPFLGDAAHRAYRSVFRDQGLDLDLQKGGGAASTLEPLYVGTVEVQRTIDLQENLLTLGYPIGKCGANGILTEDDMRAVNWFRQAVGQPAVEFADETTVNMISEQAKHRQNLKDIFSQGHEKARDMLVFQPGLFTPSAAEKAEIRSFQVDLYQAGYKIGPCMFTGVMNDETVAAVTQFKKDKKIYPVTNAVDDKTRDEMRAAAFKSAAENGIPAVVAQQGVDYLAAVLYGQIMSEREMKDIALKYIKERGVPEYVVQAVMDASRTTGMDFTYMLDMASIESGFRPWAGAGTSSAVGNFQFIEATWLHTFRKHAGKYGYEKLIAEMNKPQQRQYVLDLRKDPKISALMAAEFALENLAVLKERSGGAIGKPELYLAHFLGATEAARFINQFRKNPSQEAASMFADAAKANEGVFYAAGKAKSLGDVYKFFSGKMSGKVLRMVNAKGHQGITAASAPKA